MQNISSTSPALWYFFLVFSLQFRTTLIDRIKLVVRVDKMDYKGVINARCRLRYLIYNCQIVLILYPVLDRSVPEEECNTWYFSLYSSSDWLRRVGSIITEPSWLIIRFSTSSVRLTNQSYNWFEAGFFSYDAWEKKGKDSSLLTWYTIQYVMIPVLPIR